MPEKATNQITTLRVGGHDIKLQLRPDEKQEMEAISQDLSMRLAELTGKMSTGSQAKIATMVAFEYACQLAEANQLLTEAEKLHRELEENKQAVRRLEGLLEKVDNALLA